MRSNSARQCCEGMTLTTISAASSAVFRSLVASIDSGRMNPGRKRSLMRFLAMLSETSGSFAQSRI